jgi:hypothetical protein
MQIPEYAKKVIALLPIKESDLKIPGFRYYVGTIKTSNNAMVVRTGVDAIIESDKYDKAVIGIRTYTRNPIFNFIFKERTNKRYAVKNKEVSNIIEAYEKIYNDLTRRLPCYEVEINNDRHIVLLNVNPIAITYNFDDKIGLIYESRDIKLKPTTPIDPEECIKYRETYLFDYYSYPLTVKEYLLGSFLLQYLFILDATHQLYRHQ